MFGYTKKTLPVRYAGGPLLRAGQAQEDRPAVPNGLPDPKVVARFVGGDEQC